MTLKKSLRSFVNKLGLDVSPADQSPRTSLLGLKSYNINSVIDVGSNSGQFAKQIIKNFPRCNVYCFEPLDAPFSALRAWAKTKGTQIKCYQLALGEYEGQTEMYLHVDHDESSSLLQASGTCHALYPQTVAERRIKINVSTLDKILIDELQHHSGDIFLKLDVQGFEDRVLKGGTNVLKLCRAVLLEISLDKLYENQADFYQLTDFMYRAGFRYAGNLNQILAKDGHVIFLDALYIKS
jgi:FkbM family methyltransferase